MYGCLKTALRKSKRIFLLCAVLASPGLVRAMDAELSYVPQSQTLTIDIINPPSERIFEFLDVGMRTEITYEVRTYSQKLPALRLFRKKSEGRMISSFISEEVYTTEARYDPLRKGYRISADGGQSRFVAKADFLNVFLTRKDIPLTLKEGENRYFLVRVRLRLLKLVPPLTILDGFIPETNLHTAWKRLSIDTGEGAP